MSVAQLLDQVRTDRQEAKQEYRELLTRGDSPKPSDAERLRELMSLLQIDVAQVERDFAIVKQATALESQAAGDSEELTDQVEQASAAWQKHSDETARIIRERKAEGERLLADFQALQTKQTQAQRAARMLADLQQKHAALFGVEPPAAEQLV